MLPKVNKGCDGRPEEKLHTDLDMRVGFSEKKKKRETGVESLKISTAERKNCTLEKAGCTEAQRQAQETYSE